ncbi:hypothetical protein CVN68_18980 [Sphingomonas psychrotolerans]|uniref:Uncharacterized protein n=1 Tax=Sphingomonas psychrotolerans TaxID=1327635 RepID=A0A2K8ML99_9SPHN|nr:hypothetical protein CVN68_18980 [Sphingomonas psychrotolerans]
MSGYRVPTSLTLADRADTIFVGTVMGERREADGSGGVVLVRPTLLLKGSALPQQVALGGWLAKAREMITRSDPRELRQPNSDALGGGCTRYVFAKDMKLLLFFERKAGKLVFAGYPFARVSEDVPSDDSRWVKAVRTYVAIAALPGSERKSALIARRDALRAQPGDTDAAAIADDIDRELAAQRTPPFD